jgi:hypothetical protein
MKPKRFDLDCRLGEVFVSNFGAGSATANKFVARSYRYRSVQF